ncbi:methyl-accepting chemotaxis protein [Paenibacillus eucommiae]|uniref:Methyl-accepting chemotaxis protein n=1 Tax=Paenibacillus eucommiae TaxID=1355755 RepID=A0ABS4JC51_9BACL|nr:methyl-accepting chemotaxis protein [Paenibacillus eucommiae]MBP1996314.1 methyl-accepting chemotaxis protein [Paenibacillus eucommiae]
MNSLQTRIVLFFSALLVLAGSVLGLSIYLNSKGLVETSIGMQANAVAERAIELIQFESYAALNEDSEETPYYWKLRTELNNLRQTNGLKYLYTLGIKENAGVKTYYYVVDGAPEDAEEGDFSKLGEAETNGYQGMMDAFATGEPQTGDLSKDEYGATLSAYVPFKDKDGNLLGVVGADFDASGIYTMMDKNRSTLLAVSAAILAVSLLLVFLLARYLAKPLIKLTGEVAKVRSGDLTVAIDIKRKDEIGRLAESFQQLVTDTRIVIQGIGKSAQQLQTAAAEVLDNSVGTADASAAITASIKEVSQGADQQVIRTADMTKAMEEMTTAMQRIAESSSIAAEVSQATTEEAEHGNSAIGQATIQMEALYASSQQMVEAAQHLQVRSGEIVEIASMMTDVAGQTNLLALNAAIEAARAGENGRGFAVVAEEVRKLSTQSHISSSRISELIETILQQMEALSRSMAGSSSEVRQGLLTVKTAGEAFGTIVNGLKQVNVQVQGVSAATEQVTAGAEEAAASVDEMERITRQAAEHFKGVALSSSRQQTNMNDVASSAKALTVMSEELKLLIDRFKV